MKLTEEQVKEIATKVLTDIEWTFNRETGAVPIEKSIEKQIEEVSTQKKHPRFEEYVASLTPFWVVLFDFPEDDGWDGRNMMFVKIKDETGEPYEVGHRQWKGKVLKDSNGKYYTEDY
jgi:hypothetical protein